MRYAKGHKDETRQRIIDAAARRFRKDGIESVGLVPLMNEVGLTHGGFYSHFTSKEALVAEAIRAGFRETNERFARTIAEAGVERGLAAMISLYLSDLHRDQPEYGCAAAALASELGRLTGQAREAFGEGLADMLHIIENELVRQQHPEPQQKAKALVAAMVGAIVLSRATCGTVDSDEFLEAGRNGVGAILDAALSR